MQSKSHERRKIFNTSINKELEFRIHFKNPKNFKKENSFSDGRNTTHQSRLVW